ncbi:hypothetical protein JCM3775_004956 [Rhodotorula graminis]|uniref:Uncharacterized protein n=1 Tax=Rhodotorula graminis (strain WP1) TaxID=578459 RepID=A0A194S911_RHOGW|nr:uncharacterized protein RHOBADRAFT_43321 [Rhodotorula graminis WP1]KPV75891.1 hypothetical protein RHOBADRAFT_43321 [Rhodotorula graminis WP1]
MPSYSSRYGAPPLNDDPLSEPKFLAGLEAAGYLQRLDTSEARITARYQHALSKMSFASHSEEFLTRAGVRKVHRSTVQFFTEDPTPMDPFVHVMVGSLPPSRPSLVTPRNCETSSWTPIGSEDEADGTVHFTVTHPGFWPVTVVFDCNREDLRREDRFSSIRAGEESDSDPEAYLPPTSSRRARGSTARRDSMFDDTYEAPRGARGGSRRGSYIAPDEDSTSDDDDEYAGRRAGRRPARRESMSARDLDDAIAGMSLGRSNSRASMRRSSSRAGSRRAY